jgi:threonine aldolase
MRQVGVLAAPGLIALTEMVDRLKDDHVRARRLAQGLNGLPGVRIDPETVETDIVIFGFEHPALSCGALLDRMKDKGILALAVSGGIRMVTHKDVGDEDVERAIKAFREILS